MFNSHRFDLHNEIFGKFGVRESWQLSFMFPWLHISLSWNIHFLDMHTNLVSNFK